MIERPSPQGDSGYWRQLIPAWVKCRQAICVSDPLTLVDGVLARGCRLNVSTGSTRRRCSRFSRSSCAAYILPALRIDSAVHFQLQVSVAGYWGAVSFSTRRSRQRNEAAGGLSRRVLSARLGRLTRRNHTRLLEPDGPQGVCVVDCADTHRRTCHGEANAKPEYRIRCRASNPRMVEVLRRLRGSGFHGIRRILLQSRTRWLRQRGGDHRWRGPPPTSSPGRRAAARHGCAPCRWRPRPLAGAAALGPPPARRRWPGRP